MRDPLSSLGTEGLLSPGIPPPERKGFTIPGRLNSIYTLSQEKTVGGNPALAKGASLTGALGVRGIKYLFKKEGGRRRRRGKAIFPNIPQTIQTPASSGEGEEPPSPLLKRWEIKSAIRGREPGGRGLSRLLNKKRKSPFLREGEKGRQVRGPRDEQRGDALRCQAAII